MSIFFKNRKAISSAVVIFLLMSLSIGGSLIPPAYADKSQPVQSKHPSTQAYKPTIESQKVDAPKEPIPAQVIIQFAPNTNAKERAAYIQSVGGTVVKSIASLDTVVVNLPEDAAQAPLPESPLVAETEPDYYVSALDDVVPNDPRYAEQWALPAIGAPSAWGQMPMDAPKVTVAVIDSGICASHPDLIGRTLNGWDFLDNDTMPQDDFGHGCSVAGVIAANMDDGIGIAGVAPNAQIMPLRVLNASGVGSYSDVAAAIVYAADNGAQVINLSLGGSNPSSALENAVNYAISKGVVVVAAAGNNGIEGALYPAAYPDVIAVGSVDSSLQHSSFSNYGSQIDIWAPGRDVLTTKHDGGYGLVSGTSFAAPYVAGATAIELSKGNKLVINGGLLSLGNMPVESTPFSTIIPIVTETAPPANPLSTSIAPDTGEKTEESIPYLGMVFTYPSNWILQPLPYKDFGFRISSPNIIVDPLGRPLLGGYLSATIEATSTQEWEKFILTNSQKTTNILGYDGIVLSGIESETFRYTEWHFYTFGQHNILRFVSNIDDFDSLLPVIAEIISRVKLTGVYEPEPTPPSFTQLNSQAWNNPAILLPFIFGPGKIINDYNASTHTGALDYGLDLCEGDKCSASNYNDMIYAPTNIKLILNTYGYGMPTTSEDYHLFEVTYDLGNKLCLAMGHFLITNTSFTVGKTIPRQAHIGRIINYTPSINHIHMNLYSVPMDESCAGTNRTAVPFDNTRSDLRGQSLDSVDYHIGTSYINSAITSHLYGMCAVANGLETEGQEAKFELSSMGNTGCDGGGLPTPTPTPPPSTPPPGTVDGLKLISVSSPTVQKGQTFPVSITYEVVSGQLLESRGDLLYGFDPNYFNWPHQAVTGTYNPGQRITFNFNLTAPQQTGTFQSKWQFMLGGVLKGPQAIVQFTVQEPPPPPASWAYQIFSLGDFNGDKYESNSTINDLSSIGKNDWAESLKVNSGYEIIACTDANFSGTCARAQGPAQFADINALAQGLRRGLSSIKVCAGSCPQPPSANFDAWPLNGNAPFTTAIHIVSMTGITNCSWDYGDGQTSNTCSQSHNHTYNSPGSYSVRLTVSGSGGQASLTRSNYIIVNNPIPPAPSAEFDAWPLSGNAPFTTAMHIVSIANITSCSWDYGDGQTGNSCSQLHNHTYTTAGSYTVRLTVTGPGGQKTTTRVGYINVSTPPCPTINNWMGEYWTNPNLSGSRALCRDDADPLNLDWGIGSPDPIIPADNFSARWTRTVYFTASTYRFNMRHDDGGRLYIDNVLKLDKWGTCCTVDTVDVPLSEGNHTVRMEMNEYGGAAHAQLWWTSLAPGSFGKSAPVDTTILESGSATISWNSSGSATSYEYCVDTTNNSSCDTGWLSNGTSTSKSLANLTQGQTYYWHVRAKNSNGTTYSNNNAWWSFTIATVKVIDIYTTDENGTAAGLDATGQKIEDIKAKTYKTNFSYGDSIRLYFDIQNDFATEQSITKEWEVTNPAGNVVPELSWTETTTTGTGVWWWYIARTIPDYLVRGEYTFTGRITYNGTTTVKSMAFTIDGPSSIEAFDAFTTDGNGLSAAALEVVPQEISGEVNANAIATNFNTGGQIQLYIDTYNDVAEQEPAYFAWSVYDPWGRYVEEMSWSGELNSYLGRSRWWLSTTIPAHALTGDYTFEGSITYGNRTTYSDTTFHVTGTATTPSNDSFNSPIVVSGIPFYRIQDTWTATSAMTDPIASCGNGKNSNSVWYRYTAPASGTLHIDTFGSSYDTVVTVWTGSVLSLVEKGCNDDSYGETQSWLEVPVNASTVYYIEVADYGYPGGGDLWLNIDFAQPTSNDDFGNPTSINTYNFSNIRDTRGSTKASDDPDLTSCNRFAGQSSIWYRFIPTVSGVIDLDTRGSDYDTMLAIWTGSRGDLSSVACNDDIGNVDGNWDSDSELTTVQLLAGTTYYIEVSQYNGMIDIDGAQAEELGKPNTWAEQSGKIDGKEVDLKNLQKPDIDAQFWGGQLQLHTQFYAYPATPILSSPNDESTLGRSEPVTLSFNPVNGASQYYVEFRGGPGININSDWMSGTSWDIGSQWGGVYQWHVKAKNVAGLESDWSPTQTLTVKLGTSANLQSTLLDNNQVKLTWEPSADAPGNITGYKIFNNGTLIGTNNSTTTEFTLNISCGEQNYFTVQAYKDSLLSDESKANLAVKCPAPDLSSPPQGEYLPLLRPALDWNDIPDVELYIVQISDNTSFTPIIVEEWTDISSFTPRSDLPANSTLYWRVRVGRDIGLNAWSDTKSFTTPNPPSVPRLVSPNPDSITMDDLPLFKWAQVLVPRNTEFDHYQIQVSPNEDFSALAIDENISDIAIKMYSPETELASGTLYYWRMRAFNTSNESSSWSEVRKFTTPNPLPDDGRLRISSGDPTMPLPNMLAPTKELGVNTLQPTLDWTDVVGATGYIVQVSTDQAFSSPNLIVSATTVDSQYPFIKDAPSATILYWRILSIQGDKISNWSEVLQFTSP